MKENYKKVCMAYIRAFEKKQGLLFDEWIDYLEVADFGVFSTFYLSDIRHDIDTKQPKENIINWHYAVLDNYSEKGFINYKSWCMGKRYK